MNCKIFISYRHDDSNDAVNWLYKELQDKFGSNILFMDTGNIETGDLWKEKIQNNLEVAEVVLVIIGPQWLVKGTDEFGIRRIDKEDDWVRMEIELALKNNKIIYPILIDGAKRPPSNALPESIQRLLNHQAYDLKVTEALNSGIDGLKISLDKAINQNNAQDSLRDMLEKVLVGKYKISKQIGSGIMTKVYQAFDTSLDRQVAIKAVRDECYNDDFVNTLKDAAKMTEYIPNSIQILGAWTERAPRHVVMSFLKGGTLREKIEESDGRGLPLLEAHKQIVEVGEALIIAHTAGLAHCNIKPSNIFLGINKEPYISPFSRVARINEKFMKDKFTKTDHDRKNYREDLCYLAPEIFDKDYRGETEQDKHEKIDQYMLGLLAYELMTGAIPNTVSAFEDIEKEGVNAFKKLDEIVKIKKECPINLSDIIQKMISINPAERYQNLEEAILEIKQVTFNAIEIAKESYKRCMTNTVPNSEFFKTFYAELIRISPEAAAQFKGKGIGEENEHKQYNMLREAIFILLIVAEKKSQLNEPNIMTRIAESHDRNHYNISGSAYDDFLKALTNTVCGAPPTVPKAFDGQCEINANEKNRIKKAWEDALNPGLTYIKGRYFGTRN